MKKTHFVIHFLTFLSMLIISGPVSLALLGSFSMLFGALCYIFEGLVAYNTQAFYYASIATLIITPIGSYCWVRVIEEGMTPLRIPRLSRRSRPTSNRRGFA